MEEFITILGIVGCALFIVFFFGFCIFIHEFGHLLAALWRGLHIDRFSIGFGKAVYTWEWRGIKCLVSLLPFGGYVALPQLDPSEEPQSEDGTPLSPASPGDRMIVAIAGPLFNILFGFFLAAIIWHVGIMGPKPVDSFTVGYLPKTYIAPDGTEKPTPSYAAGLREGDVVTTVNGSGFTGWRPAFEQIAYSHNGEVTLQVERRGQRLTISYQLAPNPDYEGLGYPLMQPMLPTRVAKVLPDGPAAAAGLQEGDVLMQINGMDVVNSAFLIARIQEGGTTPIALKIKRGANAFVRENITPEFKVIEGENRYVIGVQIETVPPPMVRLHPTPWSQFTDVVGRTYNVLRGLFDRHNPIKARHMSGPVGILHMLWVIVRINGFMDGLSFIVLVSFSLAIINLFPLPVLDGGHVVFAAVEMLMRRRIPTRLSLYLQYAFAILLVSFFLYVTYFDVLRVGHSMHHQSSRQENASPASAPAPAPPAEPTK